MNEKRGADGEYSYTRKLDDRELLNQVKMNDKRFTEEMKTNKDLVEKLKGGAQDFNIESKKQVKIA